MTVIPIIHAPSDIKVPNTVTNNRLKGAITQHTNIENPIIIIPIIINNSMATIINPTQRIVTVIRSISIAHKVKVVCANIKHPMIVVQ